MFHSRECSNNKAKTNDLTIQGTSWARHGHVMGHHNESRLRQCSVDYGAVPLFFNPVTRAEELDWTYNVRKEEAIPPWPTASMKQPHAWKCASGEQHIFTLIRRWDKACILHLLVICSISRIALPPSAVLDESPEVECLRVGQRGL